MQKLLNRKFCTHSRPLCPSTELKLTKKRHPPPAALGEWQTMTVLLGGASVGNYAAARTKLGAALSAPIISMACGFCCTKLGILPTDCVEFDFVWKILMTMAAALYLLESDFKNAGGREGGVLLASFFWGAFGMLIGACLAYFLLQAHLGHEGKQLACCLCASYIGGSTNFAAVSKIVGLSAASIPSAMAVDNLAMAACLCLLMGASSRAPPTSKQPSISTRDNTDSNSRGSSRSRTSNNSKEVGNIDNKYESTNSGSSCSADQSTSSSSSRTSNNSKEGCGESQFLDTGQLSLNASPSTSTLQGTESTGPSSQSSPPSSSTLQGTYSTGPSSQSSPPFSTQQGTESTGPSSQSSTPSSPTQHKVPPASDTLSLPSRSAEGISLSLFAAAASCLVGELLASALKAPSGSSLAFMSVAAVGFAFAGNALARRAQLRHKNHHPIAGTQATGERTLSPFLGATQMGMALTGIFFCTIGASAGSLSACASETPAIFGFIAIMVATHWVLLWLGGRAFPQHLSLACMLLSSNALVGGPATAAGFAASKGWFKLVQPAMLCGSFGYATATLAGLTVARVLGLPV